MLLIEKVRKNDILLVYEMRYVYARENLEFK